MIRCTVCHYVFGPELNRQLDGAAICPICLVRTPPVDRRAAMLGRPIFYPYMDSD